MILEHAHHRLEQQALCLDSNFMVEHVVIALRHRLPFAHDIPNKLVAAFEGQLAAQQPARTPVWSTHMAREESHVKPEIVLAGNIGNCGQMIECLFRDRVRVRLKVIPQQKEPDDLQADLTDYTELLADFACIEVIPPIHGLATRPVIDAKDKIVSRG